MLIMAFLCLPYPRRYPPRVLEDLAVFACWMVFIWGVRLFMFVVARAVVRTKLEHDQPIEIRRWLSPPILAAACFIIGSQSVLVPAGFAFARNDLAVLVDEVRSGQSVSLPLRIGIYRVERIQYIEDVAVWFVTHSISDDVNWSKAGFVYWIDGANHPEIYHHLTGRWYYFSD